MCVHLCICVHVCPHTLSDKHISLSLRHPHHIINLPSGSHLSAHWSVGKYNSRGFNQAMGGSVLHAQSGKDWTSKWTGRQMRKWDIGTLSIQDTCDRVKQYSPLLYIITSKYKQTDRNFSVNAKVIKGKRAVSLTNSVPLQWANVWLERKRGGCLPLSQKENDSHPSHFRPFPPRLWGRLCRTEPRILLCRSPVPVPWVCVGMKGQIKCVVNDL